MFGTVVTREDMAKVLRWVSVEWLRANLDRELTILDCQPNVHDYVRGHIPGAVYLAEESLRLSSLGMPHVWLDEGTASSILSRVGVPRNRPVLTYSSINPQVPTGDGVPQCMMAYSLARYGHENIFVLDGGLDEWMKGGGRIETRYPAMEPSSFSARLDRSLFIEYEEFLRVKDDRGVVHIDTRSSNQYQGRSPWPKEGHIPGAINIPWSECFAQENLCLLRPKEEIGEMFSRAGVTRDKTIICHCGSGRKAAAQLIVLKFLLGFPEVRLFEGSFTEWCAHPENPTVTGPSPSGKLFTN